MTPRRKRSQQVRHDAAEVATLRTHPVQATNADEQELRGPATANFPSYVGNFTKGLEHDPTRFDEVNPERYRELVRTLTSGSPDAFEDLNLSLPTVPPADRRKLVNPQAGLAFDLQGPDGHASTLPPAPRLGSAEMAAEMAELYWMALLRDVSFIDFGTGANTDAGPDSTADASQSLSAFSDFRGPKDTGGAVTPATLFRGFTPGDLTGPYVSQFLLKPVQFGTLQFNQRQLTAKKDVDYLIDYGEWRDIQNGRKPTKTDDFDLTRRYVRNARDLATYVHFDALYEAYFNACLILLDMRAPFDPGNPYGDSKTQDGFGTFGGPHILSLVTEVATRALKAVWFQKWYVHRRLRPEAFGGLVHNRLKNGASYPIHVDLLSTTAAGQVLHRVNQRNLAKGADTFLLAQAFPEGSPIHPAYGAGHATVAGACVTILKAWFDESEVFDASTVTEPKLKEARRPKIPNALGTGLVNYVPPPGQPPLTVGGELNKLAANVAIGRNMAGVHWRTDYTESLKLGEAVAIGILEEQRLCYNEPHGLSLTKFDGTTIVI